MKTTRFLVILILALGMMLSWAKVSDAAPMGTAFTYQGRLMDANDTAQGVYDIMFHLYDSPEGPNEIGVTDLQDVEIVDGYFTVELGFDVELFSGGWRWLEISVRPGDSNDPDGYIPLNPRQQITPTPYAFYARRAGIEVPFSLTGSTDVEWIIGATNNGTGPALGGISTAGYGVRGQSTSGYGILGTNTGGNYGYLGGSDYGVYGFSSNGTGYAGYFSGKGYFSGNVGIGTTSPAEMLHIHKSSGSLGLRVSSDATSYQYMNFGATNGYSIGRASDDKFFINRDEPLGSGALRVLTVQSNGNVGIGTTAPDEKLTVEGTINANGDLVVENGAFRGNVGPNNGAPFPRPAYDSGWIALDPGWQTSFPHNIGGNVDNYVVDVRAKNNFGIHNEGIGSNFGYRYLDSSSIAIWRGSLDTQCPYIRVRIWVAN